MEDWHKELYSKCSDSANFFSDCVIDFHDVVPFINELLLKQKKEIISHIDCKSPYKWNWMIWLIDMWAYSFKNELVCELSKD